MSDTAVEAKTPKDRSPSFPFIPLQTAVERLIAFEQTFGRHETPANKVGRAWKMTDGSSQAFQTIAALKQFGLLDYKGTGPARATFLTEEARKFVRAQQESIKREVIRTAALKPKAMEKFWAMWGTDRPIDDICLDDLHFKHGFTQSAAATFLRVYDETIAFAGLTTSDAAEEDDFESFGEQDADKSAVEVGDLVQVEINGALTLSQPARVRAIQVHDGKSWVFIDGSESGVPLSQVLVQQKGVVSPTSPPTLPMTAAPALPHPNEPARTQPREGWKEERLIDDDGDETFISYKGEPSVERYEFIRDYLTFRIGRLRKTSPAGS
ncbi:MULTISPECIES: hypothetical protein [Brevundimonas]|uniref:hypothetical protein n=1 Tax=Brevundimonas TaxID=41275 RepID=UPI0025BA6423|nr:MULTISPECIES: hypothetical protein [Brevundimonas]